MYVKVNGVKLYFDVDGEGMTPDGKTMRDKPTVIMVHGGPGADHTIAKPYFSQLTDIAQVIYYDHRGNGRSDLSTSEHWTLAQWGDDLKGLCDALGIEKPIVIGTSFGGFVSLSYATRHPEHVGGLVLISTAAKMQFDAVYDAFERLGGADIRAAAEAYWGNPTDESRAKYRDLCVPYYQFTPSDAPPDWLFRVRSTNDTALWFNGPQNEHGRMDFVPDLKTIPCPALVMVGEEDPITPPVHSDVIAEQWQQDLLTYVKYEKCGHGIVGDRPEEALEAMRAFIGEFESED